MLDHAIDYPKEHVLKSDSKQLVGGRFAGLIHMKTAANLVKGSLILSLFAR